MPRVVQPNDGANSAAPQPAQKPARNLAGFNFDAPAELFPSRGKYGRTQVRYRRFSTAAEAVRFAVEEVSPAAKIGRAHV